MFIPVNGGQGISRPFVVGLILLLVFLGMQSDFAPSRPADSAAAENSTVSTKDSTKERIILELSKSNEKLEAELHQLQQHILLLKHAAHQHGVEHNSRLGVMLYDDGYVAAQGNATHTDPATSAQEPAANATSPALHDARAVLHDSSAVRDSPSKHTLPHRIHHQTQGADSSTQPLV